MSSVRAAWPYEVLVAVPYESLVAVDDGEVWQQELALKLLEADDQKVECEWDSDSTDLCCDAVVRVCDGTQVSDLGLCYAPLEQLVKERAASLSVWIAETSGYSRAELLAALAHVRRRAVPCELPVGPTQWALPPNFLGDAVPTATGGLEHYVEDGHLVVRAGSGGLSGGEDACTRSFGRRSSDQQMLEFGVCALGNPADSYIIRDMPGVALAAWEERAGASTASGTEANKMIDRVEEIRSFAACTPGLCIDNAVLLRDADAIGPSWPGIPGPNVCDLNTITLARWLTIPASLLVARLGLTQAEWQPSNHTTEYPAEQWATRISTAMRQPLPPEDELRAWQCLLCVLEAELGGRPAASADEKLLHETELLAAANENDAPACGPSAHASCRSIIEFRLDKTRLLADAVRKLQDCITASLQSRSILLAPNIQRPPQWLQMDEGLQELTAGLSADFVKQAVRMPAAVRILLLGTGPGGNESHDTVTPVQLLRALRLPELAYNAACSGLHQSLHRSVLRDRGTLSAPACAELRRAVDAAVLSGERGRGADTVDGAPDFQVNLSIDRLTNLVGTENMARLGALLHRFEALQLGDDNGADPASTVAASCLGAAAQKEGLEVFVRRYNSAGRCAVSCSSSVSSRPYHFWEYRPECFVACTVWLLFWVQTLDSIPLRFGSDYVQHRLVFRGNFHRWRVARYDRRSDNIDSGA